MKTCRVCLVELIVGENWTTGQAKFNNKICITCRKEYDKEYCENNKEKKKEYYEEYYQNNKDRLALYRKEHRSKLEIKKKNHERQKEYYKENKEKIQEHHKEYRAKPETKKKNSERHKARKKRDLNYKIAGNLRTRMSYAIRT